MLLVKDISKKINKTKILRHISFHLHKGEILGFLGPNGAGKTTSLRIITGFWKPTNGSVKIDGIDVMENQLSIKKKIGYLPETVPLYDDMKVIEYLKFVAAIRGINRKKSKQRIKEVIKACGLKDMTNKLIDELSKGYRQRLGLAQAIIHNPAVLILDEPTSGLDPNQIIEIRNLIKKLVNSESDFSVKAVIFSTHILSEVSAICNRVIIINKGKIVGQGSPKELANKAGSNEIIYVKIKGPRDEVFHKLKTIENIVKVRIKDKESDNIYGYEISPKSGVDLREKISTIIIKSGWNILEFNQKDIDLEDIFRRLTK